MEDKCGCSERKKERSEKEKKCKVRNKKDHKKPLKNQTKFNSEIKKGIEKIKDGD